MTLKEHFANLKLTQDELAQRTGLSQSTISRLHQEDAPKMSIETAKALHATLGIPLEDILSVSAK